MKIEIAHIPNTYNYGSLMMAINLIKSLSNRYENQNIEFYVDCSTNKDLERLKSETLCNNIYVKKKSIDKRKNKIFRLINFVKKIDKEYSDKKAIIIVGGDDISEYYGKRGLIKELLKLYFISKKVPVFLVGQTVGPFSIYTKELAKIVLNRVNLYTRDFDCLNYVRSIGVKDIFESRDLAFLELPLQNNSEITSSILNKYDIKDKSYIVIVPSGLTKLYTKNEDNYIDNQVNIVKSVLENKKLKLDKVVLLPHVLIPKEVDDRIIIGEIMKRIDDKYKDKIIPIYDELLSSEARIILGNSLFSITGRMHAAVSTYQMGRPSLALSYSVKYKGVLGSGLGMNDLIIEADNDAVWQNNEIVDQVNNKINHIIDNYNQLVVNIKDKLPEVKQMISLQMDDITNKLN
ncbi:polysaccharide pyruvyl transferase family protein [Clostridium arbusti]|uniref:polysaccharide pyruvyl transferase family protein n=1 Tax=Clostridium arbusti TaxID=1137848 RepID=UPI000288E663|nr:polysaccharide pyruvyl transferase family protein [Clostridium arbusti]